MVTNRLLCIKCGFADQIDWRKKRIFQIRQRLGWRRRKSSSRGSRTEQVEDVPRRLCDAWVEVLTTYSQQAYIKTKISTSLRYQQCRNSRRRCNSWALEKNRIVSQELSIIVICQFTVAQHPPKSFNISASTPYTSHKWTKPNGDLPRDGLNRNSLVCCNAT